ncbi:MAG: AMP-binding protein [Pseudomonadales bacterium]
MTSVYQAFRDTVATYPKQAFVHIPASSAKSYSKTAVDLTYAQADQRIDELKEQYHAAGYGHGQRVGLLLENRADFFLHWFALNSLGVSVVPINGEMTQDEKAYLLAHSDVCLAVCVPEKTAELASAIELSGSAVAVVASDTMNALPPSAQPMTCEAIDENTECAVLYTSGSTGKPKGCLLNNEYFLSSGRWYRDLGGLCTLTPGAERLITPLPVVHMNAMACSAMGMLFTGGCIIQLDRFHPSSWWQAVRDSEATALHYLGVMPAILLNMEAQSDDNFAGKIKFGFGAGINSKHHAPFEQRFGFPLIEAWAMTESGCGGCIAASEEPRHIGTSCFGKPSVNVETRLVDEHGADVAPGEDGELLVRAAGSDPRKGFFSGYYKNPEATAEAWEGGWLHTGDVVRVGPDGAYHFVDRRKNVIRRSGENISALEVEATLVLNECIDQAAVTAVPDEIRGDEVMACVVLKDASKANRDVALAIFEQAMQSLVYFKTPGYIAFVDALPLTASNKPQRGEIKTLARELLQRDQCYDLCSLKKRNKANANS